ncbi:hypothetical protein SRB5_48210 [Streptomyces sp. RB5]|uniref:VOC domain-containing protein n=1 Tax=Streptomyces smaragdinus TaxID=2585196 RepID=A0A7K0CME3_9ACTN|nr:VOC family protein [Streptomyces smaragdinus]MQY14646.1 hypothetical protein [Streptomyces smaragdinus]
MITRLAIAPVWSTDQDRSLKFYTEKLGFEKVSDLTMGEGGMRWVTVCVPGKPETQLTLMDVHSGGGLDPDSAEALTALVDKGVLGAMVLGTDDCRATYEELRKRGVEFVQEPVERPYGTEAILRDDSGNWFSLTEAHVDLDTEQDWA